MLHNEQLLLTAPLSEAAGSLRSPAAFFMIELQQNCEREATDVRQHIGGPSMPRTKKRRITKTNWSAIGQLRRPNATWRLGRAARWFEEVLDLAPGAVVFLLPDGRRARTDKKLGSLRTDWTGSR